MQRPTADRAQGSMATIFVDARCLQGPGYRYRGVGQHAAAVLRQAPKVLGLDWRLVGLIDPRMEALHPPHRALFDDVSTAPMVSLAPRDWFLTLSPMTHNPMRFARILTRGQGRTAAIVYDFIPHEMPDAYLPTPTARIAYANQLAWLKRYDRLLAISQHTADRAETILGVAPRNVVNTGVAVRSAMICPDQHLRAATHFLVVGGGDQRKNPEVVLRAHARSSVAQSRRIPLLIAGGYPPDMTAGLRSLYAREGGKPDLLQILEKLSDADLAQAYRDSILTICPSRNEGFSIPVVEANANGAPVVVSQTAAQMELIPHPDDQFGCDDVTAVWSLIDHALERPHTVAARARRQEGLWRNFTEVVVGERFWALFRETPAAPMVHRGAKPKVAIVTPLPPDESGVADYSAATLPALCKRAEVHVFTSTEAPRIEPGCASIGAMSAMPYLSKQFDAVVSVVGNSHFHTDILELALDYGGAILAHDARMINVYAILLGAGRATAVASRELGAPVSWTQVQAWLHDQKTLPVLFLSELLEAASPFLVHSRITQKLVRDLYGAKAEHLPFCSYRQIADANLTPIARATARARLGVKPEDCLVASFGLVAPDKGPEAMIWALQQLTTWGVPARLALVGRVSALYEAQLKALAQRIGVADRFVTFQESVPEAVYRDYLCAADVGLQLRGYALGGLSGGVLDCASAGLPSISNASLIEAMEPPHYIHSTPDDFSPVLIAESIASLAEDRSLRDQAIQSRQDFLATRTFDVYADALLDRLGLT